MEGWTKRDFVLVLSYAYNLSCRVQSTSRDMILRNFMRSPFRVAARNFISELAHGMRQDPSSAGK